MFDSIFSKLCVLSQMNVTSSYNAMSHLLPLSKAESTTAVSGLCRADSSCVALHRRNWLLKLRRAIQNPLCCGKIVSGLLAEWHVLLRG